MGIVAYKETKSEHWCPAFILSTPNYTCGTQPKLVRVTCTLRDDGKSQVSVWGADDVGYCHYNIRMMHDAKELFNDLMELESIEPAELEKRGFKRE